MATIDCCKIYRQTCIRSFTITITRDISTNIQQTCVISTPDFRQTMKSKWAKHLSTNLCKIYDRLMKDLCKIYRQTFRQTMKSNGEISTPDLCKSCVRPFARLVKIV